MSLSMRPRGGYTTDKDMYSPSRDLAWISGDMVRAMIEGLRDFREAWLDDYLEGHGVTMEVLAQTAVAFAEAFQLFVTDEELESPRDALTKTGFFNYPEAAQVVIMAKLGQIFVGAMYVRVREVSTLGQRSPVAPTAEALVARAYKMFQELQPPLAGAKSSTWVGRGLKVFKSRWLAVCGWWRQIQREAHERMDGQS